MIKLYQAQDKKPEVFIKAVQYDEDKIRLFLVDENGNNIPQGNILTINKRGICFYPGINERAPFTLDSRGAINIY